MCAEAVLVGDAIDASLRTYLLAAGETAFHIFGADCIEPARAGTVC
jgi:hypothetical protein